MILPDVNLLVLAYNAGAAEHAPAREWWEHAMRGDQGVGLSWAVLLGYVRIMTNRSAVTRPIEPAVALRDVREWLQRPNVAIVAPGARHLDVVERLFASSGATGRLATDVHLAALAIEHQAELHSCDADFARFPGLRRRNPLA